MKNILLWSQIKIHTKSEHTYKDNSLIFVCMYANSHKFKVLNILRSVPVIPCCYNRLSQRTSFIQNTSFFVFHSKGWKGQPKHFTFRDSSFHRKHHVTKVYAWQEKHGELLVSSNFMINTDPLMKTECSRHNTVC